MRRGLLSFVFACLFLSLFAQQPGGECGTYGEEVDAIMIPRLLAHKRALRDHGTPQRNLVEYVPVKFQLVGKSDGSERIDILDVLGMLKLLNEQYAPVDMQFYLPDSELGIINNTQLYTNHFSVQASTMTQLKDDIAMNVWIVETADDGMGGGGGQTLAYYSPFRDWIVVSKDEFSRPSVLGHEIGHFFDLPHTFRGWDGDPHPEEEWGENAPVNSPGGPLTEKADSSNCETAADMICDTPADYNLGLGWNGCDFTAIVLDPMGDTLMPQERNFMGYFLDCPADEYFFTTMQIDIMQTDLASNQRNYLREGPAPFIADIDDEVQLYGPSDEEVVPFFDEVTLTWTPAENARKYVLEVSRFASFTSSSTFQYITGDTTMTITDLVPEEDYYWRVTPFNDMTCGETSDRERFTTSTVSDSPEPTFVESHLLSPNPAQANGTLLLELSTEVSFRGEWQLYDITGRPVGQSMALDFRTGYNAATIPAQAVPAGVYIWRVQTEAGHLSGRLVLTQ